MEKSKEIVWLACLLFGWYASNSVFAVLNKEALKAFGYPWVVSWLQLVAGVVVIVPRWILFGSMPKLDLRFITMKFGPMAILHATGHMLQVAAAGSGSVFMANVVKATEPIIGTVVAIITTGTRPKLSTALSLLPIALGVGIAGYKPGAIELFTFSSIASFLSCFVFALAKVLAKNLMTPQLKRDRGLDAANNYALLTCCSTVVLTLPAIILQGPQALAVANSLLSSAEPTHEDDSSSPSPSIHLIIRNVFISGAAYFYSNNCSFQVLDLTGPVTQAVANAAKRVFVLGAAVIFLGEPITTQKLVGSALALLGVLLYGLSKTSSTKKKTKSS